MKKLAIAGASAVLAAMPVVGVFAAAENPANIVDTITVTIEDSCTWSRTLEGGTSVTASGSNLTATKTANQTLSSFGTSTLNAKCNNSKGYTIKATMTALSGKVSSDANAATNNDSIDYATSLAAGKWVASYGGTGITSGSNIATTSASDDMVNGTSYAITYGVQTKTNQTAGVYTGTATYELIQNS